MNIFNYLQTTVDQILINHKAFQLAQDRIKLHLNAAQNFKEPICLAVVGESRTGKSRLLGYIAEQFPSIRSEQGMEIPVLSIETPSKPSVKGLVETLLCKIGDPIWAKRGSEIEKTERLYVLLKQTKTHTLVIDEFQHFYDKVSHKVQHYLSDWLKIFVGRSGLTLIVAGLPSSMAVINQNEQLRGRFQAPIHMPRFDWGKADERDEFISCLEAFQSGLPRYEFPDLSSEEVAFRFYCATGGLIGYVAKILHQACLNAQTDNTVVITMADLGRAYAESVWSDAIIPQTNPFSVDLGSLPAQVMMDIARHTGTGTPEVTTARSRKSSGKKPLSGAEVLSA